MNQTLINGRIENIKKWRMRRWNLMIDFDFTFHEDGFTRRFVT